MVPKNHGQDSIHSEFSDSHLLRADEALGQRLDKQDEAIAQIIKDQQQTRQFQADQVASTKHAVIGIWASAVATIILLIGGGFGYEHSRRTFNEFSTEVRAEMRQTNASLEKTNQKLDTSNDKIGALEMTTALMQKDLRPIDALDERVRKIERAIDRANLNPDAQN